MAPLSKSEKIPGRYNERDGTSLGYTPGVEMGLAAGDVGVDDAGRGVDGGGVGGLRRFWWCLRLISRHAYLKCECLSFFLGSQKSQENQHDLIFRRDRGKSKVDKRSIRNGPLNRG